MRTVGNLRSLSNGLGRSAWVVEETIRERGRWQDKSRTADRAIGAGKARKNNAVSHSVGEACTAQIGASRGLSEIISTVLRAARR